MKPITKIASFLLAVVMLCTALLAAGCTPISSKPEWSYKTGDRELAIGVYIYSLKTAYQQAETYAKELDDYDSSKDSWLDMEITDDDGDKAVAREWIKSEAKTMCLSYLVLDEQIKKEGVEISDDTIATADEAAQTNWDVGPYASYGYIMPMKDELEPFGVSFESFAYCTNEYSVKYQSLFDALYSEGGSKAVTDDELTKFFTESYTNYSYIPVNLYTSSTDEAGQSTNVAMSDDEIKKITDELEGYVKDINSGKSFDDVKNEYMKANDVADDPATSSVEVIEDSSLGDELKEAIGKLDVNKAATVKVGSGDSAICYLVFKGDVNNDVDEYIKSETNRPSVLAKMKQDEFADYIEGLTKELKYEENTSVIDKYDPQMFFEPVEPTTAASDESSDGSSDE